MANNAIIIDGRTKVVWCTAIANTAAPTTTELNAGTALQTFITPDGLNIVPTTGKVPVGNLGSKQTPNKAGRIAFDISVVFHHQAGTDTPRILLPYRTDGFLVVRYGIDAATAWNTGDKVEVYPINTGEPMQTPVKPDSTYDFTSPMFVSDDAQTSAVVA